MRGKTYIFLLALTLVLFFYQVVFLGQVFFLNDFHSLHVPAKNFLAKELQAGRAPLWCPQMFNGFPFAAEDNAYPFYPFSVFFLFFPPAQVVSWFVLLHFFLAGLFLYLAASALKIPPFAAYFSTVIYVFSGFFVAQADHLNIITVCAWLPLLFLLAQKISAGKSAIYAIGLSIITSLMLVGGQPQAALISFILVLAYGLCASYQGGRLGRGLLIFPPAFLLGILSAGIQIIPTLELIAQSVRRVPGAWSQEGSLHPLQFLQFLLPSLLGDPRNGTYWGANLGAWNFEEYAIYLGILPFFLLLFYYGIKNKTEKNYGFLKAAFLISMIVALGHYLPFNQWLYRIPVLRWFRNPARFIMAGVFCASLLSGQSLSLLCEPIGIEFSSHLRKILKWLTIFTVLGVLALTLVWTQKSWLLFEATTYMDHSIAAKPYHLYPHTYYLDKLWRSVDFLLGHALAQLILAGAALLLLYLRYKGMLTGGRLAAAAILLVTLDLFHFGFTYNPTASPQFFRDKPAVTQAFDSGQGTPRVFTWRIFDGERIIFPNGEGWTHGGALNYFNYRELLPTNYNMLCGSGTFLSYSPLALERHARFTTSLWQADTGTPSKPLQYFLETEPVLSLAGVEYLVSIESHKARYLKQIYSGQPGIYVYKNALALPRAYLAGKVEFAVSEDTAFERTLAQQIRLKPVVLEGKPFTFTADTHKSSINWVKDEPQEIVLQVKTAAAGVLVLVDEFYPGWQATLDEAPVEIYRANYLFRAVQMPEGSHVLSFTYHPRSYLWGLIAGFGGILLIFILLISIKEHSGIRAKTLE